MGLFNWKKKQEEPVVQENSPVSCHFSEIAQEIITKLSRQSRPEYRQWNHRGSGR